MLIPPPIPLNDSWIVEYVEQTPADLARSASGQMVPTLRVFARKRRADSGRMAWLTRTFDVPPMMDICLRFDLHLTAAASRTVLYLNGQRLGEVGGGQPFALDVTGLITLDDNLIGLLVDGASEGAFGDLFLKAEPCGT